MRADLLDKLGAFTNTLAEMCGLAGAAMQRATEALLQADLELAARVIENQEQLTVLKARAEENEFLLLALQGPVARNLRIVVGALQNVADAERMGGLALHVATIARRRHPENAALE